MKVSYAIQTHPSRRWMVSRLLGELPDAEVIVDIAGLPVSAWRPAALAWRAYAPDATHHVVLHEDVILCNGFRGLCEAAIAARPDVAVTFFANYAAIEAARDAGASWAELQLGASWRARGKPRKVNQVDGWLMSQCIALPVEWCPAHADYGDQLSVEGMDERWDDVRLREFLLSIGAEMWATVPSLVQHGKPSDSLLGYSHSGRVARVFEQTPGQVDFSVA